MLPPNLFTYFCKAEFTFSILPFIVDANKGKLRFYSDALCLNAAEALLPRHSYNASTPFLQNPCFIRSKGFRIIIQILHNQNTSDLKKIPDVRPLYSFKFAKKLTEKKT